MINEADLYKIKHVFSGHLVIYSYLSSVMIKNKCHKTISGSPALGAWAVPKPLTCFGESTSHTELPRPV